jgi:hypothetical protein
MLMTFFFVLMLAYDFTDFGSTVSQSAGSWPGEF